MAEMKNLKVEVVRYNPEVDTAPHSAFYDVPYDEQTSLLDALGYIKDNLAPDLSYRWSCRMAICGSCGMMVNKVPKLACKPSCAITPKASKLRRWPTSRSNAIWWWI